ncbi:MAG TPA: RNA methyltransferase [Caulobacterales bacterium]|nr:RNA methyltransferase [Caulobacterales bacterium]
MKRLNRLARARPAQARAKPAAPAASEAVLDVAEIGARGDAVSEGAGGPIYVAFALPGERVRARVSGDRAQVIEVLTPSADRRAPPCRHFGRCGGCQLQHWDEAAYLVWKRERVVEALARRNIGFDVAPTIAAWGEGRRRAAFHATRQGGAVRLGFQERGGARLQAITQCPVLAPPLEAALPGLAAVADMFLPARGEITLHCLWTEAGLDVAIKGAGRAHALNQSTLEKSASIAETADLARLSLDGEPIVTRRAPFLRMGRAIVSPTPGAFLQPTALGEETLARLACEALAGASRVIDLFSGIGTFALRLAEHAEVQAAESDGEMLAALKHAADAAGGALKHVSVLRRDLLRTPLANLEMKKFDAAVIDPPRSGARLQAEQIGRSGIRRLAYVSCDPATFARDVRVLADFGFSLSKVTPVDQFRWSPHVEVVGALER